MDKVELRLSNLMAFDAAAHRQLGLPARVLSRRPSTSSLDGKVALKPFVERHPLDDIDHVFDAVHRREIRRRAVLVPA